MVEGQQDVVDGCAIGHGVTPDEAFVNCLPMKPPGSQLSERTSHGQFRPSQRRHIVKVPASSRGFRAFSIAALLKWLVAPIGRRWRFDRRIGA